MAENRFLQSPLSESDRDTQSIDLPAPVTRSTPARSMRTHGLMPPADLQPVLEEEAAREGVPVNVLSALAQQESNYNPDAVGVPTKWGRAKGMLQYIDPTANGLGIDPFETKQAIGAAARQLRERLDKGDTMEEAIMAHHGGDNRKQWGPKTRRYGVEVLDKADAIGQGMLKQKPAQAEEAQKPFDLKAIQAEMDAKEPGRYQVLDPEEVATRQSKRRDIASGQNAIASAMDSLQGSQRLKTFSPLPVDVQNRDQQSFKDGGAPITPLTIVNQIRAAKRMPLRDTSVDHLRDQSGPIVSYLKRSAISGLYDLAGAGAKVLDTINPWTFSESDIATIYKDQPEKYQDYLDNSAGMILNRFAKAMTKKSEENMRLISPEASAEYGDLKYATTDMEKSALTHPVKVIGDAVRSLPSTVALAVTAYVTRGAAQRAEAQALAAGATPEVARQVGIQAGMKTMAQVGATSEGAIGYAQQANQTWVEANKAAIEKSPRYQGLLQQGFTPETARAKIVADTAEESGKYAGIVDSSVNLVGGQFLGKIISEGGKFIPRVMKGFANEAATETAQSAGEKFGENLATKNNIDPNQSLSEGTGEAAVQGMAVGGLTGGVVSGAFGGGRNGKPDAPNERVEPTLDDAVDPTATPGSTQDATTPPTQSATTPAAAAPVEPAPAPDATAAPAGPLTRAAEAAIPAQVAEVQAAPEQAAPEAAKPAGEPVTVRSNDGELPGTLESYTEDGQGNWSARVMSEDGNAYEFTQADGVSLERAPAPTVEAPKLSEVQNVQQESSTPSGAATEANAATAGKSDAAGANRTEAQLRTELKAVATELRTDRTNADLKARRKEIEQEINRLTSETAQQQTAEAPAKEGAQVEQLTGDKINKAWTKFAPDSGTLDIPRADMPQIKAEHRGALVNFLEARGIVSTQEEVPASSLKPTQQEFSPAKVRKAKAFKGGDRSILVSSDGHVVDGHHQWMAKLDANEPIKVIRLDAPISRLLDTVREFPSSSQAGGATAATALTDKAAINEPSADGVPVVPGLLGDSAERKAIQEKGFQSLEVDVQRGVLAKVLSAIHDPKVFKGVVERVPVDVVNMLTGKKLTAKSILNNPSVLRRALTVPLDQPVPTDVGRIIDAMLSTGETVASAPAVGVSSSPITPDVATERDSTVTASESVQDVVPDSNESSDIVPLSEGGGTKPKVSDNKIFTEDAAERARKLLRSKLTQLNSGVDPEILQAGITLAGYHIEKGARTFAAYAKAMTEDLGDVVKPYLKSWYMGVKYDPRASSFEGMSSAADVEGFDVSAPAPAAEAPAKTVTTPSGREFEVRTKVVEADSLVTSNNADGSVNPAYPQELQPRDRGRSASIDQINDIASKLNPKLLGESASATDGAPIVSPDGVVESGNGRTLAIRQAYARNPEVSDKYRAWLKSQGHDVDGMKAPVLVRERVTPMDTAELQAYTAEANERTTLAMSSTERAMADAKKIGEILHLYRGGDVQGAANREFVRGFMSDVAGKSDRGTMMDGDGMLSQEGRRRIEAALLAAAYGDANIVTDLFESGESDIKSIGGALLDASGEWALMRQEARDGTIPAGVDTTPHLMEAVNLVRRARAEGRPIFELVNQSDIFAGDLSQATKAFVSVFYRGDSLSRARGRDKVADALLSYTRQARAAQPGNNLFGEPELTGPDLLRGVNEKLQRQEDNTGQGSLFGGQRDPAERAGDPGREGQRPRTGAEGEAAPKSGDSLNAPGSRSSVERDRQEPGAAQPVVPAADGDAAGQNDTSTGRAGDRARAERDTAERDQRVPADGAATRGERGDQLVHQPDGQFRPESGTAGSAERTGSGSDSVPGTAVEQERAGDIVADAPAADASDFTRRLEAQRKADKAPTKRGDKASIDAALPLLLPEQRDDVLKAEQRHAVGNGMLHTNGTGTGKTASGLGLAKRFINDGKDNIAIVVPSDKIASDWVKFAAMMGIELKQLSDTKDNGGSGPIITTYANFAANESLALRDWDLAITDESHYLSSNEAGETTGALEQLRALTGHHDGFYRWASARFPKERQALNEAIASKDQASIAKAEAAWQAITKPEKAKWDKRWAEQADLPKTLFLSATPFPYVKNVDYAEGYLFDYVKPADLKRSEGRSGGYNSGSPREQFFMQHFGYRMRTNKLTAPEAGVDSELMEQNFNQWLKSTGALSGRRLEVPFDYDRKFAVVDDAVGQKIDEGLKFLREDSDGRYRDVYDGVMKQFDYHRRQYLLESIKARAVVPIIKEHMKLGRKVVVFHDFNKGGGFDPFVEGMNALPTDKPGMDKNGRPITINLKALAQEAMAKRPDLFKLDLKGLRSPIATLGAAFDNALFFNGTVPKKDRRANADAFNDDSGTHDLIVVQSDAGREGVSLHDTTGKRQRVLINLGMPGKPVAAIQIEGRTYRTGQASDAIFRYLTTGTAWEASAFASKIAERASTAENLALGTEARGLKQSFIDAYTNADLAPASAEDGKGGKAYDRNMAAGLQLSGFTKAKTYYFAQQKNTRRRDQREGSDYYATPEPVGFKMAEWANIQQGDKVLEPSAGHGAIARFFPDRTDVTMVEPSYELSQRAALANGTARIVNERFEDLHIANKYDAVVMNPPYGSGGKTAIEHVSKAAKHLRDGGRIVALIPRGGITDKRLEAFLGSEDAADLHLVAKIDMPASTFERAGTAVNTQVLVLEKHVNPEDATGIQQRNIDLSNAENIGELFDRIEDIGMPDRIPSSKPEPKEEIVEHTTGKGKVLRGVIRTGLTRDQAKEIDPFTFKKGDGYFIRAKYLDQGKQSVDAYRGFSLDVDGAKFSVQPDGLRSLVEAEPLDLAVAPELAARPLADVRAEAFTNLLANRSTTMTHPSVGTITFNRAGITKSRSTSNDPAKVLTMGQLDEIVSEAAYLGRSEPEGDSANIVRYHYLGRRLTVDGEPMLAMITLRENADGRISYYNHSMLQDAPTVESVTAPQAANDNAKYQRPALRMERLSLSDGTTATPGQADRIRGTLTTGTVGKAIGRLIDSGRIVLHDTVQTLPGQALPGTQAMTMPDGTVHLVAENLTPQTAMPVMLHEMFHAGGESLVGSKRWGELQGRLSSLHRQFSKSPGKAGEFYAAAQRVKDAQAAGNTMSEGLTVEEFGAYAIEQYESAPATIRKWVDDVIGAIKEFMYRRFGIQLGQVSPAQLRAMAVQAVRQEATTAKDAEGIRYSLKPSKVFKDLTAEQKTFLDKIGPERLPQRLKDRWSQLTDNLGLRIRQAGVDRYAALLRNDKALLGEETLEGSIADSAWVLARMSPSAGGAVSALLNNGRIYLDAKEKVIDIKDGTKGLADTLRKLGSPVEIDRFMGWIAANRSKRLLGEGKENLFTPEEIEAGIKLSGGKLENGKSRSILYAQAWKEFQQHRDDVLGIAQDTGIITPEQRDTWSEEFYVPFYRVMDEDTVGGPSSGSGISRQQAYKKLKGGKQNLNDLLDNTLLNFHHLLQASLKNQAAAQAMTNAEKLGIADKTTENKRDKKMSTFVMVDGEKQWFNVTDALTFKAVSSLADAGLNNPVMRVGRAFKRFFTNMTTITPQFVVANAIRDTLAAMATSPTSMIPLKTAFKGALTYGNDTNKARMMASGGAFSFGHVYGQNANEIKASLSNSMRTAQVLSDPKMIPNILLGAWRKYHAVTDFAENINRAGIWEHNKDRGKLKAAFEARDLMDFSAHGDAAIVRIMTDLVPFLNARIQGLDKLYRAGAKPAIKTLFGKGSKSDKQSFARFVAVVGALTAVSALLYLRNKDDEDYRKLEDWQRDSYWVIKIGDGMYFIPKPFEVGAIATMGERLLEQFVDPTVGGEKLASRMGHMLTDTFAFNPTPQAVKPALELWANENTFTGRPIEDQSMQRLSPSLRSRPDTSRLADITSRGMESALGLVGGNEMALSPVQIDHLIQGYTGAVGAGAVGLADTIWRRASGEELPARRWSEYQPIKRFYKDLTLEDNYTRYGTDFYAALKKADQSYANFQHLVKYGQEERAAELYEKKGDELAMRSTLNKVNRSMSKINAEMKRVQTDKEMSAEGKRLELDRLRGMRNLMTEEVGKELEKQKVVKRASGK